VFLFKNSLLSSKSSIYFADFFGQNGRVSNLYGPGPCIPTEWNARRMLLCSVDYLTRAEDADAWQLFTSDHEAVDQYHILACNVTLNKVADQRIWPQLSPELLAWLASLAVAIVLSTNQSELDNIGVVRSHEGKWVLLESCLQSLLPMVHFNIDPWTQCQSPIDPEIIFKERLTSNRAFQTFHQRTKWLLRETALGKRLAWRGGSAAGAFTPFATHVHLDL
jgi:hypothetical protein